MPSYLDQILLKGDSALAELNSFKRKDYTSDQLKNVPKAFGSEVEIFLKLAAFPTRNSRESFCAFIDALRSVGVAEPDVQALHRLRDCYNDAKHKPTYDPLLSQIQKVVSDARVSLEKLRTIAAGRIHNLAIQKYRRMFWLFAWDHYIGGDTEISVMIPSLADELPPDLDLIYIDARLWDDVVRSLKQVGHFELGEHLFPIKVYKFFTGEGDFLAGGVFEGGYSDLISTLAKNELRQNLITGLNRHDSPRSVLQAVILAAIDAVGDANTVANQLSETIREIAAKNYAVPAGHGRTF